MQPIRRLQHWLLDHTSAQHCLFTPDDLRALFSDLSDGAYKTLLSRAVSSGILTRVCRGIYLDQRSYRPDGRLLFRVAFLLRSHCFNYISLETALSDCGVISQIPMQRITLMSSGRSSIISCGRFGSIEFVHTNQRPEAMVEHLVYDDECGGWRATVAQALRDMKRTHRDCDLIDWDIANELI